MSLIPRKSLIPPGEIAPDFLAPLSDGTCLSLSALRGQKRVVLVFYPGDNTPVCTAQLCALRDDWGRFQARDTVVFGVNGAAAEKHARFAARHDFPFPLVVDSRGEIAAAYGCRLPFGLVRRTVYVIDRQGKVVFAQRGNPAPAEMLGVLSRLQENITAQPYLYVPSEEA